MNVYAITEGRVARAADAEDAFREWRVDEVRRPRSGSEGAGGAGSKGQPNVVGYHAPPPPPPPFPGGARSRLRVIVNATRNVRRCHPSLFCPPRLVPMGNFAGASGTLYIANIARLWDSLPRSPLRSGKEMSLPAVSRRPRER